MEHDQQHKNGVVFIASEAVLSAWSARATHASEVIGISDTDARDALDVIIHRQPQMVVLEESFACSERGAALLGRLQTVPAFRNIDIRLLPSEGVAQMSRPGAAASLAVLAHPIRALHPMTRRTARRNISGEVEAEINGRPVTLVNLSTSGAQVLSAAVLRPHQRVRVFLARSIRVEAKVAWVALEISRSSAMPRYRAGLEFLNADTEKLGELFSTLDEETSECPRT